MLVVVLPRIVPPSVVETNVPPDVFTKCELLLGTAIIDLLYRNKIVYFPIIIQKEDPSPKSGFPHYVVGSRVTANLKPVYRYTQIKSSRDAFFCIF